MRIAVLPQDEGGCGYYRLIWPAQQVQQIRPHWNVEIYRPGTVRFGINPLGDLHSIQGIPDPKTLDVIVTQRAGTRAWLGLLKWARETGIATVLDVDDALWSIPLDNAAYLGWNQQGPTGTHWRNLDAVANLVDLVTVTTPYLGQRYAEHGRVEVLPNSLPAITHDATGPDWSRRGEVDPRPALGWSGFAATHPGDLQVVGDAVERVLTERPEVVVRVVGDARGVQQAWGVPEDRVEVVPPQPIGLPYLQALSSIDVGLVPLQDSRFNRGKSWLKAMEFTASGVPVVASPNPANLEYSRTVPISLAETPADWYAAIIHHLDRLEKPTRPDEALQALCLEQHTLASTGWGWVDAWERAFNRRDRLTDGAVKMSRARSKGAWLAGQATG